MEKRSSYRWVVLFVLVMGTAVLNFSNLIFAARAVDVMEQFSLNQTQLASVTNVGQLPGAFLSIVIGALLDKRGVKMYTSVSLLLGAAFLVWRIFATSYIELMIITFMFGVFYLPINIIAPKMLGSWFAPEEMGTAMGIYGAAAGVGTTLAFAFGNLFTSGRAAFTAVAILAVALFLIWIIFARESPQQANAGIKAAAPPPPTKGGVGKVIRSANMWKVMFCGGFAVGGALLINTYLTQALILERGLDPVNAGLVSTILNVCLVIGGVLSGILVSKTGRFNINYAFICIVGGIGYYIVWAVPFGPATYVLLAVTGLIVSGSIGVNMARISLLPLTGDFPIENVGTAGGMNNTAVGIMAFVVPTVVAAIAGDNYNLVFIIAAVILVAVGLVGMTIPELGQKGKLAKVQAAKKDSPADAVATEAD